MSSIGVLKKFDKLGRIVIPKEMRDRYQLKEAAEIIPTKNGVLIRNSKYILLEKENSLKK